MSIMYSIRKAATIIGGSIFLIFAFSSVVLGDAIYNQIQLMWAAAQTTIICTVATLGGLATFVWGMGWTMSDKERKKMKDYRKLKAEKIRKAKELDRKRAKLLRKHGLHKEPK